MSRPYAEVIGDPISHSKSPLIHNFWLRKLGIDAEYRSCHVKPEELADYFARRRGDADWRGCNVTMPHKIEAMQLVDQVAQITELIGALNTVGTVISGRPLHTCTRPILFTTNLDDQGEFGHYHWLTGYNTDAFGALSPLIDVELTGQSVVVVGAGGAARAVLVALYPRKPAHVTLMVRDKSKGERLLEHFWLLGEAVSMDSQIPPAKLLINASALGMKDGPGDLKLDLSALPDDAIVYDLVYAPLETQLLADARQRNLFTIDGLSMLIAQAAMAFEIFFGVDPDRGDDAELRALLTR